MDDVKILRKQLLYQSTHRGCKETDILLGDFAIKFMHNFNYSELAEYKKLLEVNDIDLYNWITGKESIPNTFDTPLVRKLLDFNQRKYET